jgi:5'-nucleotidase
MKGRHTRVMLIRLAPLALLPLLAACATPREASAPLAPVTVGVIGLNDFHGHLEPPRTSTPMPDGNGGVIVVPTGGAAWLASAIDSIRAGYEHHVTVSAGDMIGGTPLASSLFLDEPSIGVLNRIGLDFNAVGNHEFDHGTAELRRKQAGGCAKHGTREPCALEPFTGAKFKFLSANVKLNNTSGTLFPATGLKSFGTGKRQVTVGFIGMTLKDTPSLVSATGITDVSFADEVETANALVPVLKQQGADAIVVMIHEGGYVAGKRFANECEQFTGPIREIVGKLDPRIDVVISGHTHQAYVCDWATVDPARPILLTSAGQWGKLVTDITLEIDPATNRVVAKRARNLAVQSPSYTTERGTVAANPALPMFEPRADVASYVARYVEAAKVYSTRKVGWLGAPAYETIGADSARGGPLGNLVADAQLAATRGAGAQIAFMNTFGLRANLVPAADGGVTFGDIYAVQPFNNELITLDLTGAQIKAALEQGFDSTGPEQVLTPSQGFAFSYDRSRPMGDRIVALSLDGAPLVPAQTYRVTLNAFLANGGDTFRVFLEGKNRAVGMMDVDALEAWLKANPPRVPPANWRDTDLRPELNPSR